jgi:hypothetical protein
MKGLAVVLAVILVGAVAVQAGQYGAGFWFGNRDLGTPSGGGGFVTVGLMEFGGHITWEPVSHLALRGSAAYNTGKFSVKQTITNPGGTTTSEDKDDITGFPIELNILPTFRVGDKLILRAGGGLAYHKYSDKYTNTTTAGGVSVTTTFPSASLSGIGGQFLLITEAKVSNNMSVEVQYKKDNANLSDSWDYSSGTTTYSDRETFGLTSDTYRIGLSFGF